MIKPKCYCEEDRPLLVLALDPEKLSISDPEYETAATRGAVNYLGRWPAHVLAAFIAGTLVFVTFVLFGIFTIILTIPSGEGSRTSRNIDAKDMPNFYFVKHENRTWSPQELCYIENTARTYKNLSVYLINLLADNQTDKPESTKLINQFLELENGLKRNAGGMSVEILSQSDKSVIRRPDSPGQESRAKLAAFNRNIKTIEVPIRRFFNGSRLANVGNRLSKEMIEMAAKAYILWNSPGVALDPAMYPKLDFLKEQLCRDCDEDVCPKDSLVTMEVNGDIQVSSAPCQAFLDHLIREIATIELPDRQHTLNKAIMDFCPRSSRCQGVRLLPQLPKTDFSLEKLDCPTILPAGE